MGGTRPGKKLFARQQNAQDGFFHMKAVLGFVKNLPGVGFQDLVGDLLATMGGQGMLHQAVRPGQRHAGGIQRVAVKIPAAALGFPLHAHAGPHIGEDHIGVPGGLVGVLHQAEPVAVVPGKEQHIGGGAVAFGAGHGQVHTHHQTAHNQAVGHVVAVAHKAGLQPGQRAAALPHRHQVGQHLQRVGVIRHAGDYRHPAVLGQRLHIALLEGAVHNGVIVPPQHPGGVLNGLAPGDLQVVGAQIGAQAPHLVDAHLQAGAGAGGVFAEHQGHGLALQVPGVGARAVQALVFVRYVENVGDLGGGEAAQF